MKKNRTTITSEGVYCLDRKTPARIFVLRYPSGLLGPCDTFMHPSTAITNRCAMLSLVLADLKLRPTRKSCTPAWVSGVSLV